MEPPPPPPSRDEAPAQAEKRPLDAADDPAEVAAKKQRLADPSSPIDPKDVEGLKDEHRQEAIAQREAAAKAKIQAEAEEREHGSTYFELRGRKRLFLVRLPVSL